MSKIKSYFKTSKVYTIRLPKYRNAKIEFELNDQFILFRFRLLGNMSSKMNLCLELGENIPEETEVLRWLGEPIKGSLAKDDLILYTRLDQFI